MLNSINLRWHQKGREGETRVSQVVSMLTSEHGSLHGTVQTVTRMTHDEGWEWDSAILTSPHHHPHPAAACWLPSFSPVQFKKKKKLRVF